MNTMTTILRQVAPETRDAIRSDCDRREILDRIAEIAERGWRNIPEILDACARAGTNYLGLWRCGHCDQVGLDVAVELGFEELQPCSDDGSSHDDCWICDLCAADQARETDERREKARAVGNHVRCSRCSGSGWWIGRTPEQQGICRACGGIGILRCDGGVGCNHDPEEHMSAGDVEAEADAIDDAAEEAEMVQAEDDGGPPGSRLADEVMRGADVDAMRDQARAMRGELRS